VARVYISSTYSDLREHRERVYRALRALRHDVIAMEDYVACDERPLDRCLADVARCDVYVGLFAHRFGYVPEHGNPDGRSVTELEYLKAGEVRIPRLIFLLDPGAPWPPTAIDAVTGEGKSGACIRALRERLVRDHMVSFFSTADELAGWVGIAISNTVTSEAATAASTEQLDADTMRRYFDRVRQQYARLDLDALTPPQREEYLQIQLRLHRTTPMTFGIPRCSYFTDRWTSRCNQL
jgi:hypothetical protein